MATFKKTKPESTIAKVVLALAGLKDGQWHFSGTAVLIGPGFAVTAPHVVADLFNTLLPIDAQREIEEDRRQNRLDYALGPQSISMKSTEVRHQEKHIVIYAFQFGALNNMWTVKKSYGSPATDISFLKLVPANEGASNYRAPILAMNLLPPNLDSKVSGFGYHDQECTEDADTLSCDSSTTTGKVISVHNEGLPGRISIPCFVTNARIDGGMSGCPIFNEQGQLCGIASMSYDNLVEGKHTSRIACLWPSMSTLVDLELPGLPKAKLYPVIELAKLKYLDAKYWERVTIEEDGIAILG